VSSIKAKDIAPILCKCRNCIKQLPGSPIIEPDWPWNVAGNVSKDEPGGYDRRLGENEHKLLTRLQSK